MDVVLMLTGAALLSGALGSLMGVGGGVVLIPVMVGFLGIPTHLAVAASLVAIVANSGSASAGFLRGGWTHLRLGLLLGILSVVGSFAGVALGKVAGGRVVTGAFAGVLLFALWATWAGRRDRALPPGAGDPLESRLRLSGTLPAPEGGAPVTYGVRGIVPGSLLMLLAGLASGLLGVGGGMVQVPVMDRVMGLPLKANLATSNFILGITASAGALAYLALGDVHPLVAAPVTVGVVAGSALGSRLMARAKTRWLRAIFALLLLVLALQMAWRTVTG